MKQKLALAKVFAYSWDDFQSQIISCGGHALSLGFFLLSLLLATILNKGR